jgi:zinc transporter ZupT
MVTPQTTRAACKEARSEAEMFESGFQAPFLFSLAAAGVTTLGLLAIRRQEQWALRNATYFASFAAGVLIAASVLHLFPRAIGMAHNAPLFILGGYFAMHAVNRFLNAYVCDRPGRADFAIGLVPMIGIGFHSFVDGGIYAVTFSVSWTTGAIAAAGMVLHEFPEGIVTYVLLRRSGFNHRSGFLWAFVAAGLSTPAGTIVTYPFVAQICDRTLGTLLALSAGALLYVGATHLLPQTEREPARNSFLALGAGVTVALAIVLTGS